MGVCEWIGNCGTVIVTIDVIIILSTCVGNSGKQSERLCGLWISNVVDNKGILLHI